MKYLEKMQFIIITVKKKQIIKNTKIFYKDFFSIKQII